MPVTLKDISQRVGKSVPTVSRALAGFEDISPKTREMVQRVAAEMGYEPNITARNLQKQRTDTLALILPSANTLRFSDPFFSEFLSGIVEYIAQFGYDLNISSTDSEDERNTYLKHLRSRRFDGFIVVRTQRQDARIDLLREHDVPFVAFGQTEDDNDFHLVDEDGRYGVRQVVDHLVELGHTRLACIAEPTNLTKSQHRVEGFIEGLAAHNIPFDPTLVVETHFRQRSGRQAANLLLDRAELPTALVACNDLLALGAMRAVQERGLRVGQDISVTGFDDILLSEYANPALTTVHQPASKMGSLVAQMLLNQIDGKPIEQKQVIIKPSIIIRKSTGVPTIKGGE
ncbi:LacI family DNA-binding transcriptional regulator [Candidatus Leptofilum sp.]|uniref:LacI family DNA-binding transcriptional regulator n=1 Tax=Candidatus Leptofilum sp. TaxID=3241576 RepID=UPI003B5B5A1F